MFRNETLPAIVGQKIRINPNWYRFFATDSTRRPVALRYLLAIFAAARQVNAHQEHDDGD
jgi:hypothetical protein